MKYAKLTHLIIGISVLVLFTLTGQYMHHVYNHLTDMPPTERALFRAGHIYILFSSLIHIILGVYFKSGVTKFKQVTQTVGSILLVLATIYLIVSFFTELPTAIIERPISRYGIYLSLAGVLFHFIPEKKA